MSVRTIEVSTAQSDKLTALVDGGLFANEHDVLNEALALVETKYARHAAKMKALIDAAQVGIEDIAAGRFYKFETPEELEAFILKTFDEGVEKARAKDHQRTPRAKAA